MNDRYQGHLNNQRFHKIIHLTNFQSNSSIFFYIKSKLNEEIERQRFLTYSYLQLIVRMKMVNQYLIFVFVVVEALSNGICLSNSMFVFIYLSIHPHYTLNFYNSPFHHWTIATFTEVSFYYSIKKRNHLCKSNWSAIWSSLSW